MTIAETIVAKLKDSLCMAVSLQGGYGRTYDMSNPMIYFAPCIVERESRNKDGRCTKLIGRYQDESHIEFTWHPSHGSQYRSY